jgi:bifunctional non-homologous end joining protein LigD
VEANVRPPAKKAKKQAGNKAPAKKSAARARKRVVAAQSAASAPDGVTITHPEREVFPGTGITKADVAAYYRAVAPWLLREIAGRPISVVRCPGGAGKPCFFQKHRATGWGEHVHAVPIRERAGSEDYLDIEDAAGLLELVQMNVIELHPWGATSSDPEHADRIVFDLDPHPSVAWTRMRAAARDVRARLESIGLRSFLRTTGGKGLHVVVPLAPPAPWDDVRRFAQAVSQALAEWKPAQFVSVAGEKNRKDRIFVDYLRNGRGATSVASYSLRARATAGVAMPLAWEELGRLRGGDAYTLGNALAKMRERAGDPWESIGAIRQSLPKG